MNTIRAKFAEGLNWKVVIWIALIHIMCLVLPACIFFTWKAFALFGVLYFLTGCLGVCVGYHRYLTHKSFKTYRVVRWALSMLGALSGEGPPIEWVFQHRKHHKYSDKDGDPHSPHEFSGTKKFSWSHMLWMFAKTVPEEARRLREKYAADLLKERWMVFLGKTYLMWHWLLGLSIFLTGWFVWDLFTATSLLVWGMFVRMTFVLHGTWLVNSATHLWGYCNYEINDHSRNSWWVAILTFGEGWHNNHHFDQTSANNRHRWWEFDPAFCVISIMELLGLVWDVNRPKTLPVRT